MWRRRRRRRRGGGLKRPKYSEYGRNKSIWMYSPIYGSTQWRANLESTYKLNIQ